METEAITQKIDVLFNGLRQAKENFNEGKNNEERRTGLAIALNSVTEFLLTFNSSEARGLALPLAELATALHDLNDGINHPLLQPKRRKNGRNPETTSRKTLRAICTAALRDLTAAGVEERQAAMEIATILTKQGVKNSGNARAHITQNTIIGWGKKTWGESSIEIPWGGFDKSHARQAAEMFSEPKPQNTPSKQYKSSRLDTLKKHVAELKAVV
jgi:hypothetical protein